MSTRENIRLIARAPYLVGKEVMRICYLVGNRLSFTVKVATLIFISGRGSSISSAKEGKSGPKLFGAFHEILTVYTLNSHLLTP